MRNILFSLFLVMIACTQLFSQPANLTANKMGVLKNSTNEHVYWPVSLIMTTANNTLKVTNSLKINEGPSFIFSGNVVTVNPDSMYVPAVDSNNKSCTIYYTTTDGINWLITAIYNDHSLYYFCK